MSREIVAYTRDGEEIVTLPLGAEGTISTYWHSPALKLGLAQIARIYDEGFYERLTWPLCDLPKVRGEVIHLRSYWKQQNYEEHAPFTTYENGKLVLTQSIAEHLEERSANLLQAISEAQQFYGFVALA